jgi:hypothetical protein
MTHAPRFQDVLRKLAMIDDGMLRTTTARCDRTTDIGPRAS